MVRKIGIGAGNAFAGFEVFGLEGDAIGGEDELSLAARCGGAGPQRSELFSHATSFGGGNMDVAGLENAAHIGLVRRGPNAAA